MPTGDLVIDAEPFGAPGPQSIVLAALDEFDRLYGEGNRGAHDLAVGDFDPPLGVYLVARADGHLAGGVGIRPILDPSRRLGEVKRLWVRPDLRRSGVARALMDVALARASALGYAALYLETGPLQPGARALYLGLGWQIVDAYPEGAHVHDSGTRFRLALVDDA
ncbi:MAG TPA: GNAT family N-acetyltransferase [Acidimicrobiales bacterium]|nr:GNAT family N-acetyltransferase [Acidimicrobiales bacterium]